MSELGLPQWVRGGYFGRWPQRTWFGLVCVSLVLCRYQGWLLSCHPIPVSTRGAKRPNGPRAMPLNVLSFLPWFGLVWCRPWEAGDQATGKTCRCTNSADTGGGLGGGGGSVWRPQHVYPTPNGMSTQALSFGGFVPGHHTAGVPPRPLRLLYALYFVLYTFMCSTATLVPECLGLSSTCSAVPHALLYLPPFFFVATTRLSSSCLLRGDLSTVRTRCKHWV